MAQYQPKHFQQDKPVVPKKKRKKQKKNGCLMSFLYFLFIISVSIVLSCIAIFVANDVLALVKEDRTIVFAVEQDTTVGALSDRLEEEGVIEYSSMFKLFVTAAKKDRNVMAGEYELSPSMDYMQLAMVLRNADSTQTVDVTIPEGYTLSQIRETLLDKKI